MASVRVTRMCWETQGWREEDTAEQGGILEQPSLSPASLRCPVMGTQDNEEWFKQDDKCPFFQCPWVGSISRFLVPSCTFPSLLPLACHQLCQPGHIWARETGGERSS